jgi:hypothetical protein
MRILISMLCLIAPLVHAENCEQNYVRVYHEVNANVDLQKAYGDIATVVNSQVNWGCMGADGAAFDDQSNCWYTNSPNDPNQQYVCGFRIWRTFKQCESDPKLADHLNWAFFQSAVSKSTSQWAVYDQQPSGDVHCA